MRRFLLPLSLSCVALFAYLMAELSSVDSGVADSVGPPQAVVSTPVLSARRVPTFIATPMADDKLATELGDVIEGSPDNTCLVVTRAGRTIFAHNPNLPVVPASAQKVLTGAAALEAFGRDATFTTSANSLQSISDDGVLDGDLWLLGGGDPLLATPAYIDRYPEPQAFTNAEDLAADLVALGLKEITGAVVGDETRYDTQRYVDSWPARFTNQTDRPQNQTGPLSALSLNDAFESYPTDSDANSLARAAVDPAAQAAGDFDDALEALGVVIRQSARSGVAPEGMASIAELPSPPMHTIVGQMLGSSDNSTAELLVKELGLQQAGTASTRAGAEAMRTTLAESGTALDGVNIADGSGLSSSNTVTCTTLIDLLDSAGPDSDLATGLAVAGESGTLRERFLGNAATGEIRAKTGSLNEVSSLVGFADGADGASLTFAYVANEPELDAVAQHAVQERMGLDLVAWPDAPTADELAPAPARGS